jgi:pyruvate,water dikinase
MGRWWRRWFGRRRGEDLETVRRRYERFQHLLEGNNRVLELIADAGEKLGGDHLFDRSYLDALASELESAVSAVVYDLNAMTDDRYPDLVDAFERINDRVRRVFVPGTVAQSDLVIPVEGLDLDETEVVGAKMATLGELRTRLDLPVPDGFVVSAWACHQHLRASGLEREIAQQAGRLGEDPESVDEVARVLQEGVRRTTPGREIARAIRRGIRKLEPVPPGLAVRSSALGEDAEHSFAGQHETLLNVPPADAVGAWRDVVSSLFSAHALRYRLERGLPVEGAVMAVGFLTMVRARASGVIHTVDPGAPQRDVMVISAAPGLGASIMQGDRSADRFEVSRDPRPRVVRRTIADKAFRLAARDGGGVGEIPEEPASRSAACVEEEALVELATMALRIERHLGQHQEIEWAQDESGRIVILQSRGLRISRSPTQESEEARKLSLLLARRPVLLRDTGVIACRGVGAGPVVAVRSAEDLDRFPQGGVLVAQSAAPRYASVLPRASAVITAVGGSTGHLAAVARELRVPTLVEVGGATDVLAEGMEVTVDADGATVYEGVVEELLRFHLSNPPQDEEFEEFRLLRRLLRVAAPLNLHDPDAESFRASACATHHDVVRFAHEMAVSELVDMPGLKERDRRRFVRRLDLDVPLDLDILDLGGGTAPAANGAGLARGDVLSVPLSALLQGLSAPGTWRTEPVDMDMESLLASATRFGSLATPNAGPVRPNLAVVTRDYLNLHLMLGYHFNMVDCHIARTPSDSYIYFRFLGGVTDLTRRSRRARMLALILQEYDFAVETKGDLVIGRLRNHEPEAMVERLEMIGRLIGYSRQIDVLMRDEGAVHARAREFVGREPKGLDQATVGGGPGAAEGERSTQHGRDAGHGGR